MRVLMRKELLQLRRDKRMLLPLIIAPVFQLFLFGYATNLDVKNIGLVVCDRDRQPASRELIGSFSRSGYFTVEGQYDSPDKLDAPLESGRATLALYLPSDFSKRLARSEPARLQVILDGTDMNSAGVAAGYTGALLSQFARRQQPALTAAAPLENHPRIYYNPGLKSVN